MPERRGRNDHLKRRLLERYGQVLSDKEIARLARTIADRSKIEKGVRPVFIDQQNRRISRWFLWHKDTWLPVVYDRKANRIVTVLPKGSLGLHPPIPDDLQFLGKEILQFLEIKEKGSKNTEANLKRVFTTLRQQVKKVCLMET